MWDGNEPLEVRKARQTAPMEWVGLMPQPAGSHTGPDHESGWRLRNYRMRSLVLGAGAGVTGTLTGAPGEPLRIFRTDALTPGRYRGSFAQS